MFDRSRGSPSEALRRIVFLLLQRDDAPLFPHCVSSIAGRSDLRGPCNYGSDLQIGQSGILPQSECVSRAIRTLLSRQAGSDGFPAPVPSCAGNEFSYADPSVPIQLLGTQPMRTTPDSESTLPSMQNLEGPRAACRSESPKPPCSGPPGQPSFCVCLNAHHIRSMITGSECQPVLPHHRYIHAMS